jgi:hypothetical protein
MDRQPAASPAKDAGFAAGYTLQTLRVLQCVGAMCRGNVVKKPDFTVRYYVSLFLASNSEFLLAGVSPYSRR